MNEGGWKIDQSLNAGFILAVILQGILVVWWSATVESRVSILEASIPEIKQKLQESERSKAKDLDRLARLEENMKTQTILMERIYRIVDNQFGKP